MNKILDLYFNNYLKKQITIFLLRWNIDFMFERKKGVVYLKIKKPHYKECYFETIYCWYIDCSLSHILELNDVKEGITEQIDRYLEGEKNE